MTKWTHRTLAVAILVGLTVFLYQFAGVVETLNSWDGAWQQPKLAADLFKCAAGALVAFLGALGIDVKSLLGPLLGSGNPPSTPTPPTPEGQ